VRKAWLVGVTLALAGCTSSALGPESLGRGSVDLSALALTSGTSFGECLGYCRTELRVDSLTVTMVEVPQGQPQLPTRTRTLQLSRAEWARIRALVDPAALKRLEGVHGCPDCADGGAEWIEIGPESARVRVTFEFGATLPGIAPLQAELRALRARFPR
jgi:hypothetical protein